MRELTPDVTHVNPKVASRGSVTPSGRIARPVTTVEVDINPEGRYAGGRTPPRDISRSTTIAGEIDAAEGGAAAVSSEGASLASVIVDESALLAGQAGRLAQLGTFVGDVAAGLEVLAIIDGLKTLVVLSYDWLTYQKNTSNSEAAVVVHIEELLHKNEPEIQAALNAQASVAQEITKGHPELDVYANVEILILDTWKTHEERSEMEGEPFDREVSDITFNKLAISTSPVRKEKVVRNTKTSFGQAVADGYTKHFRYTVKTYPVKLNFGETPEQRQQRTFLHEIAAAVKRHRSARMVANEHVGAPATTKADDEEDKRRRQWGEPSLQSSRDLEARIQYVGLYIEYTAFHGPDDLCQDAMAYLKELEAQKAGRPDGFHFRAEKRDVAGTR
jgi:hypothetical protein